MNISFRLILLSFLMLPMLSFSQDRRVDVLERLYTQKHYKRTYKKASRLLKKEKYKDNKKTLLFQSLALEKLRKDKRFLHRNTNAEEDFQESLNRYVKADVSLQELQKLTLPHEVVSLYQPQVLTDKPKPKITDIIDTAEVEVEVPNTNQPKAIPKIEMSQEDSIIHYAETFIGVPYKYGGKSEKGFDCSGFTGYVLENFGCELPRSARDQQKAVEKIAIKHVQKGDLVFFGKKRGAITHVGIVVSEKGEELTMIHASSSRGIMVSNIENDTYWKPKLRYAGRVIKRE